MLTDYGRLGEMVRETMVALGESGRRFRTLKRSSSGLVDLDQVRPSEKREVHVCFWHKADEHALQRTSNFFFISLLVRGYPRLPGNDWHAQGAPPRPSTSLPKKGGHLKENFAVRALSDR